MKKEETKQILTALREMYPNSFTNHTKEGSWLVLEMWHDILKNEDARLVRAALRKCVEENTTNFAPTIGQIRNKMLDMVQIKEMDAEEAWNIARGFWSSIPSDNAWEIEADWNKLPKAIKRIYSPADMVELGFRTSSKDVTTYEKPRFMKQWASVQEQERSKALGCDSISQLAIETHGYLLPEDKPKVAITHADS